MNILQIFKSLKTNLIITTKIYGHERNFNLSQCKPITQLFSLDNNLKMYPQVKDKFTQQIWPRFFNREGYSCGYCSKETLFFYLKS